MPDQEFADRTLLITGACGGIGSATARHFLDRGANVLLADRDEAALKSLQSTLKSARRAAIAVVDVASAADARQVAKRCLEKFGGIDFLVTAAGIYEDVPAASMTEEQWRRTLSVNLDGVFHICHAAMPCLRTNSSIVTLTSMAAHCGGSLGHSHYGASKGGVLALTRSLARELGPKTRVNAVSPGIIDTAMTAAVMRARRGVAALEQTPLGRFGRSEEVASVIAFLSSDAASFVTGEAIHVNGGYYMGG